jgi:hypothetical protein
VQEAYQDASRVANDAISSIRTVSSFCAEEKVAKLYEEKCQKPLNSGIRQGYISGLVPNSLLRTKQASAKFSRSADDLFIFSSCPIHITLVYQL